MKSVIAVFSVLCASLALANPVAICRPNGRIGGRASNPSVWGPACTQDQLETLWPDCDENLVFYQCLPGNGFMEMPCAPGTVFSFQHQVCVHPVNFTVSNYCLNFRPQHPIADLEEMPCPSIDGPTQVSNPWVYGPACSADQLQNLWPDCDNNLVFYQCTALNTFVQRPCAPSTVFSFQHQVCVHTENFTVSNYCLNFSPQNPIVDGPGCGCNLQPTPENDGSHHVSDPWHYGPACSADQLQNLWPDCENNLIFYQCTALNTFVQMPCAPGTVFSFQHQVCVHPENFTVSNYCLNFRPQNPILDIPEHCIPASVIVGNTRPVSNPQLYGPSCIADQLQTLWPDCDSNLVFYQCTSQNNFQEMPCAPSTVFSFQHQVCVHPQNFTISSYCLNFNPGNPTGDVPEGGCNPDPNWEVEAQQPIWPPQVRPPLGHVEVPGVHLPAVEALPVENHEPVYQPALAFWPIIQYNPPTLIDAEQ